MPRINLWELEFSLWFWWYKIGTRHNLDFNFLNKSFLVVASSPIVARANNDVEPSSFFLRDLALSIYAIQEAEIDISNELHRPTRSGRARL